MRFREHRHPCDHPVRIGAGPGGTVAARLANVSTFGARIVQGPDLAPGTRLRLHLGAGQQPRDAEVRWARGGQLGVRFAQPLDSRCLATVRKSGAPSTRTLQLGWSSQLTEMR